MMQPTKERLLGDGFHASPISFGAMGLSEFYGEPVSEKTAFAVLEKALTLGVSMIDTADIYGRGQNEELIGRFLTAHRADVQAGRIKIATKFGIERLADDAYRRRINNSPAYIRLSCENSLKRLGVERIDLYYVHRLDPEADLSETIDTLGQLVHEGKIARIGLCEVSAGTLKKAHNLYPVAAVQSEYSLWTRDVEAAILPLCRELGIGFVAYSPLGRGFLSARYASVDAFGENDFRRFNPRFQGQNFEHNLKLLPPLQNLAKTLQATPAQVALAWILNWYERLVAIPGTHNPARLEENFAASALALDEEAMAMLNTAFPFSAVHGERYTPEGMKGLNV